MTATKTYNQDTQRRALRHGWIWHAGAAMRAHRWPKRLALGVVAWMVFGIVTALVDPRTAGLIGLLGGVGAWLSAGVGLMVTALVTHGSYRRRGVLAAAVAIMLGLAATATLAFLVDWSAATQMVGTALIGVVVLYGLLTGRIRPSASQLDDTDDDNDICYRNGCDGPGWYSYGFKVRD